MEENGEGCNQNAFTAPERYKLAGNLKRISDYESASAIPKAIYKVADAYFTGEGVPVDKVNKAASTDDKPFTTQSYCKKHGHIS